MGDRGATLNPGPGSVNGPKARSGPGLEGAAGLTVTLLLAGVTLATGHGGGLYWLPAAFVLAIVIAAVNAGVLLVEVLR